MGAVYFRIDPGKSTKNALQVPLRDPFKGSFKGSFFTFCQALVEVEIKEVDITFQAGGCCNRVHLDGVSRG